MIRLLQTSLLIFNILQIWHRAACDIYDADGITARLSLLAAFLLLFPLFVVVGALLFLILSIGVLTWLGVWIWFILACWAVILICILRLLITLTLCSTLGVITILLIRFLRLISLSHLPGKVTVESALLWAERVEVDTKSKIIDIQESLSCFLALLWERLFEPQRVEHRQQIEAVVVFWPEHNVVVAAPWIRLIWRVAASLIPFIHRWQLISKDEEGEEEKRQNVEYTVRLKDSWIDVHVHVEEVHHVNQRDVLRKILDGRPCAAKHKEDKLRIVYVKEVLVIDDATVCIAVCHGRPQLLDLQIHKVVDD